MAETTVNGRTGVKPEAASRCKLPRCGRIFKKNKKWQLFCTDKHKVEYHVLCHNEGMKAIEGRGHIKYGLVEKSKRLQRVVKLLADGQWHTTREIQDEARVCAVNAIISELRAQGYDIECMYLCRTDEGGKIYVYMLHRPMDRTMEKAG